MLVQPQNPTEIITVDRIRSCSISILVNTPMEWVASLLSRIPLVHSLSVSGPGRLLEANAAFETARLGNLTDITCALPDPLDLGGLGQCIAQASLDGLLEATVFDQAQCFRLDGTVAVPGLVTLSIRADTFAPSLELPMLFAFLQLKSVDFSQCPQALTLSEICLFLAANIERVRCQGHVLRAFDLQELDNAMLEGVRTKALRALDFVFPAQDLDEEFDRDENAAVEALMAARAAVDIATLFFDDIGVKITTNGVFESQGRPWLRDAFLRRQLGLLFAHDDWAQDEEEGAAMTDADTA